MSLGVDKNNSSNFCSFFAFLLKGDQLLRDEFGLRDAMFSFNSRCFIIFGSKQEVTKVFPSLKMAEK